MYPMYPIILYPKWCQKWCKSDVSGCKTLKSDVKRPKSDRKWCKKALKWSELELLACFWPFLGIKLKLFWDEGTFRVHFIGDKVKFDWISDFAQNLLQSELDYGDSDPVVRFSIWALPKKLSCI